MDSKTDALLSVRDLHVEFQVRGRKRPWVRRRLSTKAVDGVSFEIRPGETLGIVGESGSGKTTVARAILRLVSTQKGSAMFQGRDLLALSKAEMRALRPSIQLVFQDPYGSLNPSMTVAESVREVLDVHGLGSASEREARVEECLTIVGLDEDVGDRYPDAFSGGQLQRVGIARALASRPSLLIADEPTSALDVSIQAQIIRLLHELKSRLNLTMLFISHDLATVRLLADRVAVMYKGKIVELADVDSLFDTPQHPYTQHLLGSVPDMLNVETPASHHREGEEPTDAGPPSGCGYRFRCHIAESICAETEPPLEAASSTHSAACHLISDAATRRTEPVPPHPTDRP